MNRRTMIKALALSLALAPALAQAGGHHFKAGAVYSMNNSPSGNEIVVFDRSAFGTLHPAAPVSTGGLGTGGGLGNQGGVVLSRNGRWLLAVNAGSDEISLFRVKPHGPVLVDKVHSGGQRPISIALHRNLVYVLNAGGPVGGADNIAGFLLTPWGKLLPCPGSERPLSAANTGPAQISFSPHGDFLVVTEKATSAIDVYTVGDDGLVESQEAFASVGQTPFGFAFGKRGHLIVSEAFGGAPDASTLSSYELFEDGALEVISPSVPTTETAACWVVVTGNGKFAYASNTGSNSISGYRIKPDGELRLLDADGVTGSTGAGPIDMALTRNSRFLYCLNGVDGSISAFFVRTDGSLHLVQTVNGLPAGTNGLAAE